MGLIHALVMHEDLRHVLYEVPTCMKCLHDVILIVVLPGLPPLAVIEGLGTRLHALIKYTVINAFGFG